MESRAMSELDVDHVEGVRPDRDSPCDEEHRSRNHGILESPGDECICERSSRQQRQVVMGREPLGFALGRITQVG
jgi:hypothetical protein